MKIENNHRRVFIVPAPNSREEVDYFIAIRRASVVAPGDFGDIKYLEGKLNSSIEHNNSRGAERFLGLLIKIMIANIIKKHCV